MLERPSPNHGPRPSAQAVDTLILHYTGMPDAGAAVERLCDPASQVSAHYLIDDDGTVVALVPEAARAWHAGRSGWQGETNLNERSIGVELVNPGHEWGYRRFTEAQYRSCIALCRGVLGRWPIPARRVLAHSDVAPARKQDPGELFDWRRLARAGIGLWPAAGAGAPRPETTLRRQLARFGYPVTDAGGAAPALHEVLVAFQRHWRPERVDGVADQGTLARLDGLLRAIGVLAPATSDTDI